MKKVKVESINYKISEYTQKSNKIKTVVFTFKIDNKDYDLILDHLYLLNKFIGAIPFSKKYFKQKYFRDYDIEEQISTLNDFCKVFTNYSFKVSTYNDLIFDEDIEKTIIEKIQKRINVEEISEVLSIEDFEFLNFDSISDFKTFKINLINYYASQIRKSKLSKLNKITKVTV